jgi:hypothetical protein
MLLMNILPIASIAMKSKRYASRRNRKNSARILLRLPYLIVEGKPIYEIILVFSSKFFSFFSAISS